MIALAKKFALVSAIGLVAAPSASAGPPFGGTLGQLSGQVGNLSTGPQGLFPSQAASTGYDNTWQSEAAINRPAPHKSILGTPVKTAPAVDHLKTHENKPITIGGGSSAPYHPYPIAPKVSPAPSGPSDSQVWAGVVSGIVGQAIQAGQQQYGNPYGPQYGQPYPQPQPYGPQYAQPFSQPQPYGVQYVNPYTPQVPYGGAPAYAQPYVQTYGPGYGYQQP